MIFKCKTFIIQKKKKLWILHLKIFFNLFYQFLYLIVLSFYIFNEPIIIKYIKNYFK